MEFDGPTVDFSVDVDDIGRDPNRQEHQDRHFFTVESNGGVSLRLMIAAPDIDHVIAAWGIALAD